MRDGVLNARPVRQPLITEIHAVGNANGRRLSYFMTAGQINDEAGRRRVQHVLW
jgi:hypothetical protein